MSVPVLYARGNQGSFDQGLLMHAVRGDLWPLPDGFSFSSHMGLQAPEGDHPVTIAVIAGKYLCDDDGHAYLGSALKRMKNVVLFHLGDEELRFPSELHRRPGLRIALQAPNPFVPLRGDRNVPYGWCEDTRAWLRQQPRLAASARKRWSFAGQINHLERERLAAFLRTRPEGEGVLIETPGFAQGLSRGDYYKLLAESCIVPCPSGPHTPESFRFYEALEAGCIPVPARTAPCGGWPKDFNYWAWRYPGDFFGMGDDFTTDFGAVLDHFDRHPERLQPVMTRALAWWIAQKRRYVHELLDDCRELGAEVPEPPVTVIITVSPVPSHPSVDMLADTIARVRAYPALARAEVLIMADGVRPELEHRRNDYEEFLRVMVDRANWDPAWFGCLPVIAETWVHQAENVRRALAMVRTPLVLLVEHDTYPMGDIPWPALMRWFDHDESVNHIRLHIFETVLDEHLHLYGGGRTFAGNEASLARTSQYSFRPHLARTAWMREVMARYFEPGFCGFVEDTLTSPAEGGELQGLYVYAPAGSMLRSGTVDGRGSDPKAGHGV